jgi:hypothetical protein
MCSFRNIEIQKENQKEMGTPRKESRRLLYLK